MVTFINSSNHNAVIESYSKSPLDRVYDQWHISMNCSKKNTPTRALERLRGRSVVLLLSFIPPSNSRAMESAGELIELGCTFHPKAKAQVQRPLGILVALWLHSADIFKALFCLFLPYRNKSIKSRLNQYWRGLRLEA